MTPDLFWTSGPWAGRLAIVRRPRGGDWLQDEIFGLRDAGVDVLVSLLERDEELDLQLTQEASLAAAAGIQFISFPIPDRGVPGSLPATASIFQELGRALDQGKSVAVHCRQGIGRSALIAAGLLVSAGVDPRSALDLVTSARGVPVPETPEQRSWIERVAPVVSAPEPLHPGPGPRTPS